MKGSVDKVRWLEEALAAAANGDLKPAEAFLAAYKLGVVSDPADFLEDVPLGTAEEERERARLWVLVAKRYHANEEYWRERFFEAERKLNGGGSAS